MCSLWRLWYGLQNHPSGTLTTLHSFDGTDGEAPEGYLVQGSDGNFYGTTYAGGVNCVPGGGCGTVFKITPSGTLATLYNFCSQGDCADGQEPIAGLVQASDGNFYGTTAGGGGVVYCDPIGCGTIFKITPSGTLATLYRFCAQGVCTDGSEPSGLVQASDGNFYGTTLWGGNGGAQSVGTVFKFNGTLTTLYNFCSQSNCADGRHPSPELVLVQASDGNFYGSTFYGGAPSDDGTLFRITPAGTLTTLYRFSGGADGSEPAAGLVQDSDGSFYGTTERGGANFEGTIFRLGVGLGPSVSFSPTNLDFGPQGIHRPTTPQVVTLTNSGAAPLSITSIAIAGQNSGDFAQWNNCPISPLTLAPGDYCTITVMFAPTETGMLGADVTVTDNAADSPQRVPLTGTGLGGKVKPE